MSHCNECIILHQFLKLDCYSDPALQKWARPKMDFYRSFSFVPFQKENKQTKLLKIPGKLYLFTIRPRFKLKQTWNSYLMRSCAQFFHCWTKNQGKVQLRLANFGLTWSEIQIYPITFASRVLLRSSNKGLKIWNGIGKDGQH